MKRKNTIKLRLNDEELIHLNGMVKKAQVSREAFIRNLINGCVLREKPSHDFFSIIELVLWYYVKISDCINVRI